LLIDGTVFNLSGGTRRANECRDSSGASRSALFAVSRGTFGFIAGQVVESLPQGRNASEAFGAAPIPVGSVPVARSAFSIIKKSAADPERHIAG
jgi:hypothetical protein